MRDKLQETPLAARIRGLAAGALAALVLAIGGAGQASAALPDDPFAGLEPMNDFELGSLRGGMETPFGLHLNLGAQIRSLIDGQVVLETVVTINPTGITQIHHTLPNLGNLTVGISAGVTISNGNSSGGPSVVVAGLNGGGELSIPEGFEGVISPGDNGVVATLYKIDLEENLIVNFVAVTDAGRSATQHLELSITISNFGNLQSALQFNAIASQISDALRAASLGALGD